MRTILPKHRPAAEPARHAQSWHRGPDPDAPISFADIAAMPDPDWIGRSPLAGFDAELLEPLEQTDWQARIAADLGEAIDARWNALSAQLATTADDFVEPIHFNGLLKLNAMDEAIEKLSDEMCEVRSIFDAETADNELIAIEAGLPMAENAEVSR